MKYSVNLLVKLLIRLYLFVYLTVCIGDDMCCICIRTFHLSKLSSNSVGLIAEVCLFILPTVCIVFDRYFLAFSSKLYFFTWSLSVCLIVKLFTSTFVPLLYHTICIVVFL